MKCKNKNCLKTECKYLEKPFKCPNYRDGRFNTGETNLLKETIETLEEHDLTFDDIEVIYFENIILTVKEYITLTERINYDNEYGGLYFYSIDLVINDYSWFGRVEYDGYEWFKLFINPKFIKKE